MFICTFYRGGGQSTTYEWEILKTVVCVFILFSFFFLRQYLYFTQIFTVYSKFWFSTTGSGQVWTIFPSWVQASEQVLPKPTHPANWMAVLNIYCNTVRKGWDFLEYSCWKSFFWLMSKWKEADIWFGNAVTELPDIVLVKGTFLYQLKIVVGLLNNRREDMWSVV